MSGKFTEDHVEQACLDWLEELGYSILHGPDISPDGDNPERAAYDVSILIDRFKNSFKRLCAPFTELFNSSLSVNISGFIAPILSIIFFHLIDRLNV